MLKYAFAVFLSALLLFQIQPIIAKYILPWFGGASSVWTVCLVFFQVFLLLGYLYAHLLSKIKSLKTQAFVHCVLVGGAAFSFLPIEPKAADLAFLTGEPQLEILFLLFITIGLPYALISSSGPLFQSWFQSKYPAGDTYRLYALSNTGSLLGLISYPFVVEPFLTLSAQGSLWSVGFLLYFFVCAICLFSLWDRSSKQFGVAKTGPTEDTETRTTDIFLWIGLAATSSILLSATTNQITQDIASVPFLWILPLSLYLISFIICFDKPRWYQRRYWIPALVATVVVALIALLKGSTASFWYQVVAYTGILFVGCMVCHGELYLKKPHANFLTKYYLTISFGGALGGFFVALIAPLVFSGYWELQLVWVLMFVLVGLCLFGSIKIHSRILDLGAQICWALMCVVLSFMLFAHIQISETDSKLQTRSFYGVLTVSDLVFDDTSKAAPRTIRLLKNGAIIHGTQFLTNDELEFTPTSYYGELSGVGEAIKSHPLSAKRGELNVGVLGMGAATIASLCKACKSMTFFEIDPNVVAIEDRYFSNIRELRKLDTEVDVVVNDGRIALNEAVAKKTPYKFDVLAVDAFSGDSIPVHLLTLQAIELYWQNLNSDGVLAMHVSNRHLDIAPIIVEVARTLGKEVFKVTNNDIDNQAIYGADWVLMTGNTEFIKTLDLEHNCLRKKAKKLPMWTDQYSNILRILSKPSASDIAENKKQLFTCYS